MTAAEQRRQRSQDQFVLSDIKLAHLGSDRIVGLANRGDINCGRDRLVIQFEARSFQV